MVIKQLLSYYLDHQAEIEAEIVAHRIDQILMETGSEKDDRGFITFRASDHG